jgi:hypothetical protein
MYVDLANQCTSLAICDVTHVSVIDPYHSRNCSDGGICEGNILDALSVKRITTRTLTSESPVVYPEFITIISWLHKVP